MEFLSFVISTIELATTNLAIKQNAHVLNLITVPIRVPKALGSSKDAEHP